MIISPAMCCLVARDAQRMEKLSNFTRETAFEFQSAQDVGKIVRWLHNEAKAGCGQLRSQL